MAWLFKVFLLVWLACIQNVQNLSPRLLTQTKTWLYPSSMNLFTLAPIAFKIDFKILMITFKGPSWSLANLVVPYLPQGTLGSLGGRLPSAPESRLKTRGDRAFTVRVLSLWNDLQQEVTSANSVISFKSFFKKYFYPSTFPDFDLL